MKDTTENARTATNSATIASQEQNRPFGFYRGRVGCRCGTLTMLAVIVESVFGLRAMRESWTALEQVMFHATFYPC